MNEAMIKYVAERVNLLVAEIPDRNSPDDQPEMMLVTGPELENAVRVAFENWFEDGAASNSSVGP